jgi:hypothetical protein
MNDPKDLTRWNRSGLSRLRYVNGTALTYLEFLRRTMMRRFVDEAGQGKWTALGAPPPAKETEREV